jgi:hypothetical protein
MKKSLLIFSLAVSSLAQSPSPKPTPKPETTPELNQKQKDALALKFNKMSYAQAEVREYITDRDVEHPGWKLQCSYDGVCKFMKVQPVPAAPPPPPAPTVPAHK